MSNKRGTGPQAQPGSSKPQGRPKAPPLVLEVATLTDIGRTRSHNEDYVGYFIPPDERQRARRGAIYLAADGMGGHQAGEVASRGAVELVIGEYYGDTTHDTGTSLVRAFRRANQQVYDWAQADAAKAGMGTTLVAAVILGRQVYVANVGDSRAYLVRNGQISQISEDHSWVEEQVKAGLLTPEQARNHPQRNVVTRALGSKPAVEVDLFEGEMNEGDTLFLCTDGLTGHVEDHEIAAIVQQHPPQEAAQLLVQQANGRGGSDNIGLVIVGARQEAAAAPAAAAAVKKKPARALPLIPAMVSVAVALVLVLGLLGGGLAIRSLSGRTPTAGASAVALVTDAATSVPSVTEVTTVVETATLTPPEPISPATSEQPIETAPPESTLAPTFTPTSRPSLPPKATATPTRTPQPASTKPTPYPAPDLLQPDPNAELQGKPRFTWRWNHPALDENHAFDLRIWSEEEEQTGAPRRGAIAPTRKTEAEVDLQYAPAIEDGGPGIYYWTVVVVEVQPNRPPKVVGEWGEKRKFEYTEPSGPGPKPEPEH